MNIVGIDIGGTFTDFVVYYQQSGKIRFWKELTTPQDPIEAVIAGLREVDDLNLVEKLRLGTSQGGVCHDGRFSRHTVHSER